MSNINPAESKVSLVRLNRVEYFIRETGLCDPNSPTVEYAKGTKRKVFQAEVWRVAHEIDAAGLDACALNRAQCVAWARHILKGEPRPTGDQPAGEPQPAAKSAVAVTSPAADEAAAEEIVDPAVVTENLQSGGSVSVPLPVAVWQLLLGAINLIETYDRTPGAKDRIAKISSVATVYHQQSGQVATAKPEDDSLVVEAGQPSAGSVPNPE